MKIALETVVRNNYRVVKRGFNESLFSSLSPPFPPVKLLRFDGSTKGDIVSMELNFIFFKQKWTSEIIEDKTDSEEFYFIDEGIALPFFLKRWRHKHRIIRKNNNESVIRDEIEYEAPFAFMTWALYPALLLQFAYRKPIYRKVFNQS